jgi:hypothetical protein
MLLVTPAHAQEWSGQAAVEWRGFFQTPLFPQQPRSSASLMLQPELFAAWGDQSLLFTPFARLDQTDSERTHADIRELQWQYAGRAWELRLGVGKVFWGVTESQHLVDVINQIDLVENIDGEDRLGQPMANLALIRPWGVLDLFVLPGFRTRTFAGPDGRLRFPMRVATELTEFESGAAEQHVDVAARWSHALGPADVGVAHFHGTARDPSFLNGTDAAGQPVIVPRYEQIDQTSLDLSLVRGAWLWKLELLNRVGQGDRFAALTGGVEYTLGGLFGTGVDLGVLAEYLYDERGDLALTPFEDDLFAAIRLALNDVAGTELLSGLVVDRETGASLINVEGSRRFGDHWRVSLEVRSFVGVPRSDFIYGVSVDDHLQLEVSRFF